MNIGLLVPEMPPDTIGGGGAVFEALAQALCERGHRVSVVTSHTHGAAVGENAYPFAVVRLREFPHPAPAYRTYMPPFPLELHRARAALRGCDVINAHGHGHPLVDLVAMFCVPYHKIVYTLHGFLYTIPKKGGILATTYRGYDAAFGQPIFRKSRYVTAVSRAVAAEAAERGRPDTLVINNGFTPFNDPAALNDEIEAQLQRGPYILCVGRLEMLKGFDIAIRALALIRARGIELRLVIVGRDNGALADLRELVERLDLSNAVSFVGFVDHAALPPIFQRAFATVVTSRTEAFPATPLEAMSLGSPCILSRVGGITDLATDGRDALMCQPDDPAQVSAAIERVHRDSSLRRRLVDGGLARSRSFSWPHIIEDYEAVYARVS